MKLRPATLEDAQRLFDWRNDPATREASVTTAPVAWEDHAAWLEASLARSDRRLLIAEEGSASIGTVRFDVGADGVEVSITLAPEARGRGLAAPLLRLATTQGGPYLARIRPGNSASRRAFEAAGFRYTHRSGDMEWFRKDPEEAP